MSKNANSHPTDNQVNSAQIALQGDWGDEGVAEVAIPWAAAHQILVNAGWSHEVSKLQATVIKYSKGDVVNATSSEALALTLVALGEVR